MPIPSKEEILSNLAGKDFYISMHAKAAYNQLPVAKESQMLMVFVVPGIDGSPRYFYPRRSKFGSSIMPGEFQRISRALFQDNQKSAFVYIDDVNIGGMFPEKHEALGKMKRVESARDNQVTFAFKKT